MTESNGSTERPSTPVRSVTRALTLLSKLTADGLSLTQAAQSASIPLPTALRLMRTLEREGFAQRRDDGNFVVGPAAVMLAYQTDPTGPLRWMMRQAVNEMRDATGETVGFFLRSELKAVCIESAQSRRPIRWVCPRGANAELHLTVPGRVLLAFGPTEELLARLPHADGRFVSRNGTMRSIDELQEELDKIKETGVATSDFTPGSDAWGVALKFPAEGPFIGALIVAGPRARTSGQRDELIPLCQEIIARVAAGVPFGVTDGFLAGEPLSLDVP